MNVPFFAALFLVFITLKLTGVVAWSWLWVTAPLWGMPLFCFCVIFITLSFKRASIIVDQRNLNGD